MQFFYFFITFMSFQKDIRRTLEGAIAFPNELFGETNYVLLDFCNY
jgi:hypothetical protein